MGEYTANNYFYKPALGAKGATEKSAYDAALAIADAQIKSNKDHADTVAGNPHSVTSDEIGNITALKGTYTAGENIAQYDTVYIKSDGKIYKAKANAAATCKIIGIASAAIASSAAGVVYLLGEVTNGSWSWTIGVIIFLSAATGGALTETPPSGGGQFVVRIGLAISTTKIILKPELVYMEV